MRAGGRGHHLSPGRSPALGTYRAQQAEEELRRSEAFLAEAQNLSSTGSFSWRVGTDKVAWSEQLYRSYEFDPDAPVTLRACSTGALVEANIRCFSAIVELSVVASEDEGLARSLQQRLNSNVFRVYLNDDLIGVVNLTNRVQSGVFVEEDVERVRLLGLVIALVAAQARLADRLLDTMHVA